MQSLRSLAEPDETVNLVYSAQTKHGLDIEDSRKARQLQSLVDTPAAECETTGEGGHHKWQLSMLKLSRCRQVCAQDHVEAGTAQVRSERLGLP